MKDLRHVIKFDGQGVLSAPKGSSKKDKQVDLYRFDFSQTFCPIEYYTDALKERETPNSDWHLAFAYSLPPRYDKMVKDARFALPTKALDTIKYLLLNASLHEDNPIYKHFDGGVKDSLRDIHREFIHKAIFIAFDYLYDPEKKYHWRSDNKEFDKSTLRDMATYTFWRGRTGRGLQGLYANFYGKGEKDYEQDGKFFHLTQEIDEYERLQEEMRQVAEAIVEGRTDNLDDESSYSVKDCPVESGCESEESENRLKIYKITNNFSTRTIDCKGVLENTGTGCNGYEVVAKSEAEAIRIVKNEIRYLTVFGHYVEYDVTAKEITISGLAPTKEGIITKYEINPPMSGEIG